MCSRLAGVFFLLLISLIGSAQTQSTSLREVISQLEATHNVTFSYDDAVISNLQIKDNLRNTDLEKVLLSIKEQTGLKFTAVDDELYIIEKQELAICANVLDIDTNRPIVGVQILINGTPTNGITSTEGALSVKLRTTYQDSITFSYIGYKNFSTTVKSLANGSCPDVKLEFGAITLNEVVITNYITSGFNTSIEDHSLQIKVDELALLPGETDNDILLAVKTLPGISAPNGKAGNLHVRGSTSDQTLILYDNIPIYYKGHYFGAISPYSPQIIDEVNVYRSGFSPDLGGRVGGAIALETSDDIGDSSNFSIGINSYYAMEHAHIKVSDQMSIIAAVRHSLPFDWQSPKLKALDKFVYQNSIRRRSEENGEILQNDIDFADLNLKFNYKFKNHQIEWSNLRVGNNIYGSSVTTRPNGRESRVNTTNLLKDYGSNLSWKTNWNSKFATETSFTLSKYDYESLITDGPADNSRPSIVADLFTNSINELQFHEKLNLITGPYGKFSAGYQLNKISVRGGVYNERGAGIDIQNDESGTLHAAYTNYTRDIGKLTLNGGLRVNYFDRTDEWRPEPRMFANYYVNDHINVKASAGKYSQYLTQRIFFDFEDTKVENNTWRLAGPNQKVVESEQYMAGFTIKPKSWLIDVELYSKFIDDLSISSHPDSNRYGSLSTKGLDVIVRKSLGKLDTWVSYGFLSTSMKFPTINLIPFETYYDQPHTISINATYPYSQWKFSLGWQYASGVPIYTNNTFFPEPGENPTPPLDEVTAQEEDGRFPAQHQLDLAVVYSFPRNIQGWNGTIGLSLINVYDQKNLLTTNYITFGRQTRLEDTYGIGFAPNLMLTLKF